MIYGPRNDVLFRNIWHCFYKQTVHVFGAANLNAKIVEIKKKKIMVKKILMQLVIY